MDAYCWYMVFGEHDENVLDKLSKMIGDPSVNLKILEEVIDIDLQMKYFKLAGDIKSNPQNYPVFEFDQAINFDTISTDKEKYTVYLIQLAQSGNPKAFGMLEKIMHQEKSEFRDWGILALQEARMVLEAFLLDENHVFISTGLGGKDKKLRYFIVLVGKSEEDFSSLQSKIITQEINYKFKDNEVELENLLISAKFACITALIPLPVVLGDMFNDIIETCNEYGDFLHGDFIITNVKILSMDEILDFIKKK